VAGHPAQFGFEPPESSAVERVRVDLARLGVAATDRVLVAVFGGPDSLALLLLASATTGGRVEAATVDHGIRPEAAGEAAFVAEACRALRVPHAALADAEEALA